MWQGSFNIRMMTASLGVSTALLLAGCSDNSEEAIYTGESVEALTVPMAEAEMADAEAAADAAAPLDSSGGTGAGLGDQTDALPDIPVSMPKIAYTYSYGFKLAGDDIASLQKKHADMCEKQGPYSCRIISMSHSGEDGAYASGQLELAVAAPKARSFGEQLSTASSEAGGEQVQAAITGEDLSKQIVDTDARLSARIVLRDRLLEVLRTRRGSVAELVEAERSVARVNEEIDQARSWLEEMRGRVAFSRMQIAYESSNASGGNFMTPIREAVGSIGTISGTVLAGLIILGAVLIPLGLVGYGLLWLRRRFFLAGSSTHQTSTVVEES